MFVTDWGGNVSPNIAWVETDTSINNSNVAVVGHRTENNSYGDLQIAFIWRNIYIQLTKEAAHAPCMVL